jgi:hypothetical protein
MFCTNCGVKSTGSGNFCSNCGKTLDNSLAGQPAVAPTPNYGGPTGYQPPSNSQYQAPSVPPYQPPTTPANQPAMLPPYQRKQGNPGLGFGITSLIISILTLSYAFTDYQGISSGQYGYIYESEIGLLFILSAVGIVFGSISTKAQNAVGKSGLGISIAAMLFTFYLAQFGG